MCVCTEYVINTFKSSSFRYDWILFLALCLILKSLLKLGYTYPFV